MGGKSPNCWPAVVEAEALKIGFEPITIRKARNLQVEFSEILILRVRVYGYSGPWHLVGIHDLNIQSFLGKFFFGFIPPTKFIPIAEKSWLIFGLGERVLRPPARTASMPGITVAVNVSPLQFRRPDFVDLVERMLAQANFAPTRLELEVTESSCSQRDTEAMLRIKALGVRLALDDFGTGYSSLLLSAPLPVRQAQDRPQLRLSSRKPASHRHHPRRRRPGRGLGMKVTAEGVETAEQHLFLRAAGVHSMQGYRFGRPIGARRDCGRASPSPASSAASKATPRPPSQAEWPRSDCRNATAPSGRHRRPTGGFLGARLFADGHATMDPGRTAESFRKPRASREIGAQSSGAWSVSRAIPGSVDWPFLAMLAVSRGEKALGVADLHIDPGERDLFLGSCEVFGVTHQIVG